ncbi:MAG: SIS domain-containing protein [Hafnia sp.]|jgi:DNA-binding MurR/RpiR family transcriptional regulator|uniref:Transcriptional regulator n=1 Tax=Obesumbacterium proteus ATCC 12841 TaxID=1354268 RepID=A0AA91INX0_9GAMM|nr:SIS domain-containing protein [Obesumbacterium proteus]MDN6019400.1 SIS domain-containing protein [Enterobacterales bacterium]AMO82871.1 RpiR family transcriptional regulator [Obesumbacterium proteus]MCE9884406.1 SIS domain-containing protein [Obesumbacterium proteus]MCE9915946.1 SIS domain-containing protein [Obesumbacterium proteus]MCE9928211.1 SIS domain-containing protein [Obesumbacterium proteus]
MDVMQDSENTLAIGAKIKMSLSLLNPTERGIAEWLITKGNITKNTSLREVSLALEVSEPLVVKVAKKIGYSGFRELRRALVAYFASLPYEKEEEITEQDNLNTVLDKVFSNSIQALKEAQAVADTQVINAAAALIYKAKHVVLLGVGGSSSVCEDFEHKLLRIGVHSHTYSDFHLMLMVACQLTEEDVVIVISQSGDTRELLNAVEIAKQRRANIVCITNDNVSPLSQLSDLSIFSPAMSGPILGQNAVARIIQLNLLDTLFIAILLQDYHRNKETLERSIEIVEPLHGKLR